MKKVKHSFPNKWGKETLIMGVINITPDSFSKDGLYKSEISALEKAANHLNDGAEVIDIGAQSTRPGSHIVGDEEELLRLTSSLCAIRNAHPEALISVDTFHSKVAKKAIELGANWINDVTAGLYDPEIMNIVAERKCPYVLTHSRGNGITMDNLTTYQDVVKDVYYGLIKRTDNAIQHGISPNQIIWDPGLGFAKTTQQNIQILNNLDLICSESFPVLVGASRKRFIGEITNVSEPDKRVIGSAVVACKCVQAKVNMVRVHDVKETSQAIKMAKNIWL